MPVICKVIDSVNQRDEFNRTPLHNSVYENRLADVKNLLLEGADASLTSIKNNTPLHTAASRKLPLMVEALLKYTSREKVRKFINLRTTGSGSTALHVAATNGCTWSVRYLLCYGANFEVKNKAGERAVDVAKDAKTKKLLSDVETDWKLAAKGQRSELESRLIKYSMADLAASVGACAGKAMTSLQVAVIKNHCNTVKVIVDARDRLLKEYKANKKAYLKEFLKHGKIVADGQTTLMTHTWDINIIGADNMVEELAGIFLAANSILKLAERDFKADGDEVYEQPSLLKIVEETIEALEFNMKHVSQDKKGKIHLQGDWQSARYNKMLRPPEYEGEEDEGFYDEDKVFAYMATLQVALTGPVAKFMRPILNDQLCVATQNNDFETFEQIIDEQFVDVNFCRGEDQLRPLHHAAINGNLVMAEILLREKRADIAYLAKNNRETVLHLAAKNGHTEVVELILQGLLVGEGCKKCVDLKTLKEEKTALHLAAAGGHLQTMLRLMRFYATYDIKDKEGKAPKDLFAQDFFNVVDEMFILAREGDVRLLQRLGQMQRDQVLAVGNTRNLTGLTIGEVAKKKGYPDLAKKIEKIVKDATPPPKPITSRTSKGFDEDFRRSEINHLRKALSSSKT